MKWGYEKYIRKTNEDYRKYKIKTEWHDWFVWYPQWIHNLKSNIWLETIERKWISEPIKKIEGGGLFGGPIYVFPSHWEYRWKK